MTLSLIGDSYEEAGGLSLYAIVANVPTTSVDPLGLVTHSGGAQALTPRDVRFQGEIIGTVQAWRNVSISDLPVNDAIWIELDKAPGCPECKWTQFVRNNQFDNNGAKRNFWAPVTFVRWRHSDVWYVDVLGYDGWQFKPAESSGSIEAIWDDPGTPKDLLTPPWVKSVMEFESLLLCKAEVPCEAGGTTERWKPAFQVTWSLTQQLPEMGKNYTASGKSVSSLPGFAAGPMWLAGHRDENGRPGAPVFVRNPTY